MCVCMCVCGGGRDSHLGVNIQTTVDCNLLVSYCIVGNNAAD